MPRQHLLIVGAGSVGKRHMQNLVALGCTVSAVDPREDRVSEAAATVAVKRSYRDMPEALATEKFDGVVVCSPPKYHIAQALLAVDQKLPVLMEKPLTMSTDRAQPLRDAMADSDVPFLLGYTYRWWPPLRRVRALLAEKRIGRVLHVRCVMSAHLADWHPWERYQDFFMASKEQGGGALLDESHFVDLMLWLFGMPREVFARVEQLSNLEIETDDNVDAWFRHQDGTRVLLHLDLYGRPHDRSITITGEAGTIEWTYMPNRVRVSNEAEGNWQEEVFDCQRNYMFVGVAAEFLEILRGSTGPTCTLEDGYNVLRILDAMRESHTSGGVVRLG